MISTKIVLTIIIPMVLITIGVDTDIQQHLHKSYAVQEDFALFDSKAPIVTSDDNTYVTWWSNKTGNDEVLFRASIDGGLTFGDKINLSNTTDTESFDAEIAADGDNVYVTWWERNSTDNEPVLRISNDGGQTFGPILQLSNNGTIGNNQE